MVIWPLFGAAAPPVLAVAALPFEQPASASAQTANPAAPTNVLVRTLVRTAVTPIPRLRVLMLLVAGRCRPESARSRRARRRPPVDQGPHTRRTGRRARRKPAPRRHAAA